VTRSAIARYNRRKRRHPEQGLHTQGLPAREEPMGSERLGRRSRARTRLAHLLGTLALLAACCSASAQESWPNRPIRLVVPLTAGGGVDMMARLTAQHLSGQLGQQFVVENQGGAGGTIAANMVAHAKPDGYTLIFQSVSSAVVNAYAYKNLAYDPLKDLISVTLAGTFPLVLIANPNVPTKDLGELIALIKANPGKYPPASAPCRISPASCSSRWPVSTSCTSPIAAIRRSCRTCSPDASR
jgi:Tripartite tricarboxylate transporter family receptor